MKGHFAECEVAFFMPNQLVLRVETVYRQERVDGVRRVLLVPAPWL